MFGKLYMLMLLIVKNIHKLTDFHGGSNVCFPGELFGHFYHNCTFGCGRGL